VRRAQPVAARSARGADRGPGADGGEGDQERAGGEDRSGGQRAGDTMRTDLLELLSMIAAMSQQSPDDGQRRIR
jgi:hypothetical protein